MGPLVESDSRQSLVCALGPPSRGKARKQIAASDRVAFNAGLHIARSAGPATRGAVPSTVLALADGVLSTMWRQSLKGIVPAALMTAIEIGLTVAAPGRPSAEAEVAPAPVPSLAPDPRPAADGVQATDRLAVTSQPPGSVAPGSGFGLTVTAADRSGKVIASFNGTVTAALATDPGDATLGGTLSVTARGGVATFSGLAVDRPGIGYRLKVSSSGLTAATTSAF